MDTIIKERIEKIRDGILPAGYKEGKVGIIPEDWQVKKLGEISDRIKEKNKGKTNNVLTISAEHGLVNQEKYFTKQIASKNLDNYIYLDKGDFAYNKSYSKGFPMGAIKMLDLYEDGVVSSLYICFRAKENVCKNYLKQYFDANMFNHGVYKIAQEGARNHGLLNIGITDFFSVDLKLPPLQEQEKIADILSTCDKAIEKTEKLIEEKEKQKKGLMQELLTGKTRLPGFSGEWEEVKLGQISENYGGSPLEKYVTNESIYKMISIGNYSPEGKYIDNRQRIEFNKETAKKLLNKNDLVMVLNDKTKYGNIIGSTILIDEDKKYIYNQRSERIVLTEKVYPAYAWNLLNSIHIRKKIYMLSQGGTQIYVNYKTIKNIKINLPLLPEQKAIAEILSTADKEIELLNQLLSNKREEKKGLMQVLLTGIVRV